MMKRMKIALPVICAAILWSGCGDSDHSAPAQRPPTSSVKTPPVATSKTNTPKPGVGDIARSGGIRLRVVRVSSKPTLTYEGGTDSDVTPRGERTTVKAPQGGRYIYVTTRLTNDTTKPIDITCSEPVEVRLFDTKGRGYSPTDGLSQVKGNPGCNVDTQPGFKTRMTWVFLTPAGAKPSDLGFADATALEDDLTAEPNKAGHIDLTG